MKKLLKILLSLSLATLICLGSLTCFAQDIGTFEDGIKAPAVNYSIYSPLFEFDEFPNADFEQGFKYWMSDSGELPSTVATLKEENGNHFVELNAGKAWNGICSVRFNLPEPKVGESFVLLYDWRADKDADFDVTLIQWWINKDSLMGHGIRMGYGNGALIKEAENGGFNTSMTIYNHQSLESSRKNDIEPMYFSFALNLTAAAEKSVQLDNLRFCKYDSKTGNIFDLNGNLLYEGIENVGVDLKTYEEVPEKETTAKYDKFPEYSFWDNLVFFFEDYGIITVIAVVLLAAGTIVLCLIKRKKRENKGKSA